jgi:hypothetical protein
MEGSEGDSRSGADRVGEAGRAVAVGAALDGGAVPRGFANAASNLVHFLLLNYDVI